MALARELDPGTTPKIPCPFQNLPFDIHYQIAFYLEYADILKLSATNHFLHDHLNVQTLIPKHQRNQYLYKTERYGYRYGRRGFGGRWPCYECGRILERKCFGDRMRRYEKSWFRKSLMMRRCWDCAVRERWYGHLQPTKKGGEVFYLCWRCGELWNKMEEERCRKVDVWIKVDDVHGEKDPGRKCKVTVCNGQM
ncbi:hypothetical protein CTAM01_11380 [Colletotrichum tamarilloi]|uniref:F-box domain-containing protein n=1 Tax=Colletotrichum tamarilloi TaxID=1209934 RepID=A0ABQ9QXR4_9PEZI|nr:uncharacterized protein CTAM01_11380 [Colletotrichum tamarilloi]KAK1488899.1 hypothetical protein CTAM01_11380 [Colletotrichum tamarilloi]